MVQCRGHIPSRRIDTRGCNFLLRSTPEQTGHAPSSGPWCDVRFSGDRCQAGRKGFRLAICLWTLTTAIAILLTFGCATPHAVLDFTAPSTVTAGTPFTVTVTAMLGGQRDAMVNSYISFTSSDPSAILPSQYQFTSADAGSHTWTNGFTLKTPGSQTISGSLYDATGINGTATVTVSQ